tara:strand:+ start:20 stop:175 length:156 start_codon:yes stop_codon:yes gene_type:complete
MTVEELLERLERISGVVDTDFLNRYAIEGIVKDLSDLMTDIRSQDIIKSNN